MSDVLIDESGSPLSEPTDLLVSSGGWGSYRAQTVGESSTFPPGQPGQLWYVELASTPPTLWPLERQALMTANVVIYDRGLAPMVAEFLPIGGYAEPAVPSDGAPDTALDRCLRFARDGWNVARLVDPSRGRAGMIGQLSERLLRVKALAALPVLVFTNAGGTYEKSAIDLDELDDFIKARRFDQQVALTVIFSGIDVEPASRFTIASTNGLAG